MGQQVWNNGRIAQRLEAVCSFISLLEDWPFIWVPPGTSQGPRAEFPSVCYWQASSILLVFPLQSLEEVMCLWQFPGKPSMVLAAENSKPTQLYILSLCAASKQMLMIGELKVHIFWTSSFQHCWQSCLQDCFLAWQRTEAGEQNNFI